MKKDCTSLLSTEAVSCNQSLHSQVTQPSQ